jgi:MoaA/NifB/PqqE/SkfB family radical SAM enzyme
LKGNEQLMSEGRRTYSEKGETNAESYASDSFEPSKKAYYTKFGKDGSLAIPPDLAGKLGLEPGAEVEVVADIGGIEVRPNIHSLNRLYVEATSRCNLSCRTCIRNTWEEPMGDMDAEVFDRLIGQLPGFPHLESVMFSGFGEPTAHPDILSMVRRVKALGLRAEMTTNATFLDEAQIDGLLGERLDTLWISLDGTTKESYEAIREGASFPLLLENLRRLGGANRRGGHRMDIGIAFVVMKSNIQQIEHLDRLAWSVGARRILVSNVLPYSEEMEEEMLCLQALTLERFTSAPGKTELSLPRIDVSNTTKEAIFSLLRGLENLALMGNKIAVDSRHCRFVQGRTSFVRWDGKVSPCMGLLHSHRTFLYGLERHVRSHSFGDLRTDGLVDIWNSNEYKNFREKVRAFDFSYCHVCGGCNLLESNEEDCYGNTFPVCGGCLWAQGVIQCP